MSAVHFLEMHVVAQVRECGGDRLLLLDGFPTVIPFPTENAKMFSQSFPRRGNFASFLHFKPSKIPPPKISKRGKISTDAGNS